MPEQPPTRLRAPRAPVDVSRHAAPRNSAPVIVASSREGRAANRPGPAHLHRRLIEGHQVSTPPRLVAAPARRQPRSSPDEASVQ